MPRHHVIWDTEQQAQVVVPFTAEEETARDEEEAAALKVIHPVTVTYEQFESRLTTVELNDMINFIHAKDASDNLIRPGMLQAFHRAVSRNSIDLTSPTTDAFLQEFVDGGILTAERKNELLAH